MAVHGLDLAQDRGAHKDSSLTRTLQPRASLSGPWNRRAQLSIHFMSDAGNDVRDRFHISLCGMKIDNAGAKHISAVDYGIGYECLTSALQSIDKLTIKRVEMKFNFWFSQSCSKITRHVPEGRYAQFLGH